MAARSEKSFPTKSEAADLVHFEDLLADPIAQIVMRYDGTDAESVRRIMREAAKRITNENRCLQTEAA